MPADRPQPATAPPAPAHRIGLFGGSFDPVHNAHVALARAALEQLSLDQVWWVPSGVSWQKARRQAPPVHRAAMIERAITGEPRFRLERLEIEREGPSYTVDTLRELGRRHPACEWLLILGQDQYANLHTWHEWRAILSLATMAVAARHGVEPRAEAAVAAVPHRMVRLRLPPMPESSSRVRELLETVGPQAPELAGMISPEVARYIARHRLYERNA